VKKSVFAVLLALILLLTVATPVFAIALPDSTPATPVFNVYRNVLQTGDMLFLIYANIPYATTPAEPIWQTYIWRLLKTDNVTELASALPYAFNDNGYGYNLTSMYFDSGNVTANGMVWGTAYPVKLSGNPASFTTPPEYNYTISTGSYSTLTATADVKAALAARILTLGAELNTRWSLAAAYSLLSETESGTVLSIYGEAFFRGAIYGLQGMAPGAFGYVVSALDLTARTWSTTYVTILQNQYNGTWVDTAKDSLDVLFGTGYSLAWLLLAVLGCFVVLIITAIVSGDAWLGVMDACLVLVVMTRLGFVDLGATGLMAAIAVIYDSSRLWGVFK
jgi:hypothetical protein